MLARPGLGPVQLGGQGLVEDLVDQAALAGAGNTGDAGEGPQGDRHVDVLQIVFPGAADGQPIAVARPPGIRHRDLLLPFQVFPRQGLFAADDIVDGPLGHDLAPADAGAGTDVDDMIRRADGLLIVFYHDQGIAGVRQFS